jgi:hypothetical protein
LFLIKKDKSEKLNYAYQLSLTPSKLGGLHYHILNSPFDQFNSWIINKLRPIKQYIVSLIFHASGKRRGVPSRL